MVASEMKNAASYTNRSAGKFRKLLLYIGEKDKCKTALLQRESEEVGESTFFDFKINYTANEMEEIDQRIKCKKEDNHTLFVDHYTTSRINLNGKDTDCNNCEKPIQMAQLKSGLIRCEGCEAEDHNLICNDCAPKPNFEEDRVLNVSLYKGMAFKPARSDVVFMKSEDL